MLNERHRKTKRKAAWIVGLLLIISCTFIPNQENILPHQSPVELTIAPSAILNGQQETVEIMQEPVSTASTLTIHDTATPLSSTMSPQKDNLIPSCENYETPFPILLLKGVNGSIYYGNAELNRWFVLSGTPVESYPISLPHEKSDSFSISEDEKWLLTYSSVPESSSLRDQYPYYLISRGGEVFEHMLDLSDMMAAASQSIEPAIFRNWTLEWLTNRVIKVRVSYGESSSSQITIPHLIYQYYDIEQGSWLSGPIQSLPDRLPYQWVDLSPDLTRALYLTETFDFVLWDVENSQKLWGNFLGTGQLPPYATWSPDHQKIAFWTDGYIGSIQLLKRDGSGYQIIQNPDYDDIEKDFQPYRGFFAWSPNSRYLAMSGVTNDPQTGLRMAMLYIYDAQETVFVYRCPMGDISETTVSSDILWSPDGKSIVTKFPQSETVPFRLYDLTDRKVYQIEPAGFAAIAWVRDFPLAR